MDHEFEQLEFPCREEGVARIPQCHLAPEHEQSQARPDVGEHLEGHVQPWGQAVEVHEDEEQGQKAGHEEGIPEQAGSRLCEALERELAEEGQLSAADGEKLHEGQGEGEEQGAGRDAGLTHGESQNRQSREEVVAPNGGQGERCETFGRLPSAGRAPDGENGDEVGKTDGQGEEARIRNPSLGPQDSPDQQRGHGKTVEQGIVLAHGLRGEEIFLAQHPA